jgi:RNA polymerase sigma-70 factor (ECF subfamily)
MDQTDTDAALLERVIASDAEAFRVLFERYQPIVFRQVRYQLGDSDAAHDIVQETFVRIWDCRRALRPELSVLAYALRISGNLLRDAARHRAVRERTALLLPPPAPSEGDDPEEALKRTMLEERIAAIVSMQLPARCREIFLLSRFEGKNNREIALLLGVSEKTVENQITRALRVLRRGLGM